MDSISKRTSTTKTAKPTKNRHFTLIGTIQALFFVLFFHVTGQTAFSATPKTLDYYLQEAKTNSPLIHRAINDNKVVALDLRQVKSILMQPQISLDAAVMLAPIISHDNGTNQLQLASSNATHYNGYDLAVSNGGQYQAMLSLQQPLFTKPSYHAYEQKASINREINDNSIRLTKHEIDQLVSHQYLLCVNNAMQLQTSAQLMQDIASQLRIMKPLVANAIYKQTDEMLLQIEYQNYSDIYATQHADYVANLYDLNTLCGIHDTTVVELEPTHLQLNDLPVNQSIFTKSYTLDSTALTADLKINNLKYLPQVNLFANGGLNASYLPTLNRFGVSAGISFSWMLYDGHQRKIQQERTHFGLQNISFDKQNFITQQEMNKDKIIRQINALDERMQNLQDQLKMYAKLVSAYELQLSHGNISVMDYKNLLKDVAAKQQEATLARIEKESLISSYNYWNY
jgi:outer membrane protein TolC